MPRRRRVDKRRRLGAQEIAALRGGTAARLEYLFGSLNEARDAWKRVRSDLLAQCESGVRPEAFWVLEAERLHPLPAGPDGPVVLLALGDGDDLARAEAALGAWRAERERLRQARLAWLDATDLLSERERERLREESFSETEANFSSVSNETTNQQKGSHDRR